MRSSLSPLGRILLCFCCFLGWQCSGPLPPLNDGQHGSLHLRILLRGLSSQDASQVKVTISGPFISPSIVQNLLLEDGTWEAVIGQIPAGPNRTFTVQAYDSQSNLIYDGQLSGVTVTEQEQLVMIRLQQSTPPPPFQNQVPVITGLVTSAKVASPNQDVSLMSFANDPDTSDTLTFLWNANGGSFTDTASSVPIWTAPNISGTYNIQLKVSDNRGGHVEASFEIVVQ